LGPPPPEDRHRSGGYFVEGDDGKKEDRIALPISPRLGKFIERSSSGFMTEESKFREK